VRSLLIYCNAGLYCHHRAVVDADRWPDETVLLDLDRRGLHQVWDHRRRCAAELERATAAGKPDRVAVAAVNRKEPRHLIEWENAGALGVSGPPG